MKIREKPIKPKESDYEYYRKPEILFKRSLYEEPLKEVIEEFQKILLKDPDAKISSELDKTCIYYEGDSPSSATVITSSSSINEEYEKALKKYEKDLAKYNVWYAANKDAIEAEIKKRKVIEKEIKAIHKKYAK